MEIWKRIPGAFNKVSDLGNVRSLTRQLRCGGPWGPRTIRLRGKILKPWPIASGHLMVQVHWEDGTKECVGVHRLVLLAFVGPCPEGMECRHLNDIPGDDRLENLCWGTPKENAADRKRNGNSHYTAALKGEKQWMALLTEKKVRKIRAYYATGEYTMKALAEWSGVSVPTINQVVHRITWKHVI